MSWIERIFKKNKITWRSKIPKGIWTKCEDCYQIIYKAELERNLFVCPKCDYHMYISARNRLNSFLDRKNILEIGKNLEPKDIIKFKDLKKYKDRLSLAQKITLEKEALIVAKGTLFNLPVIVASFEFLFIGGSMSSIVGTKFVMAVEQAIKNNCSLVCFSTSGGARIQESLISLMQMAKTSAALSKLSDKGLPYISVLTNPTMGGVSASLAMLGDINIAEPKALIGFAGPKIIEKTIGEKIPMGFQKSEFLLNHGMIDLIINRSDMRNRIFKLLSKLNKM